MSTSQAFPYVTATCPSWTQNPKYVEACRTTRRPGDATAYTPAHPPGASATDVTSFKVGMAGSNESNLPNIMYQLWPCEAWKAFKRSPKPGPKPDAQGNPMYERYPRPGTAARSILDFPILHGIDKISTEVPWWFLEILFRLEPRLEWKDIDMLMEHVGGRSRQPDRQKYVNSWNNVLARGRSDWGMLSWREKSKNDAANKTRDRVLDALSQGQRNANTTRGSTPGPDLQGNIVPMPAGRKPRGSRKNTSTQFSNKSTKNSSSVPSRRPRNAVLEDDDDDDLDSIPQSGPKPRRRKAKMQQYVVDDESEDSAASEYEPDAGPSEPLRPSRDFEEDDGPAANVNPSVPKRRNSKRPVVREQDSQRNKKRKVFEEDESNDSLRSPPLPPNGQSSRTDMSHEREVQRQIRQIQERNRRLRRQPANATSSTLNLSQAHTYPPPRPQFTDPLFGNIAPNGYTGSDMPYGNATGLYPSNNGARDSSLRGIANGSGISPPRYGGMMEPIQHANSNARQAPPTLGYTRIPGVYVPPYVAPYTGPYQGHITAGPYHDQYQPLGNATPLGVSAGLQNTRRLYNTDDETGSSRSQNLGYNAHSNNRRQGPVRGDLDEGDAVLGFPPRAPLTASMGHAESNQLLGIPSGLSGYGNGQQLRARPDNRSGIGDVPIERGLRASYGATTTQQSLPRSDGNLVDNSRVRFLEDLHQAYPTPRQVQLPEVNSPSRGGERNASLIQNASLSTMTNIGLPEQRQTSHQHNTSMPPPARTIEPNQNAVPVAERSGQRHQATLQLPQDIPSQQGDSRHRYIDPVEIDGSNGRSQTVLTMPTLDVVSYGTIELGSEAETANPNRDLSPWPSNPAHWNEPWEEFIDYHDAEPLLKAHDPDRGL